jgi:hypothetical protein
MVALAILIFKDIRQGVTKGRSHHLVKLEFVVCTYILLTCLIYNFLLGNPFEASYWTSNRYNYIVHLFGPILFIGDFLLFSERGKLTKKTLLIMIYPYPYHYLAYIMIRSLVIEKQFTTFPKSLIVFPYFFLDCATLGNRGVALWVDILTMIFVVLGYLLKSIYDHMKKDAYSRLFKAM